jgi:nucleoside-diphosphate-sugar epimerase
MNLPFEGLLLVGGTGFIGSRILGELSELNIPLATLVRGENDEQARQRIVFILKQQCRSVAGNGFLTKVVAGDLAKTRFGLSPAVYEALTASIDCVINVSGCTQFDSSPNGEPTLTNVAGLRQLIAFASEAGAAFHHFSTAYVCGQHTGLWPETGSEPVDHRNDYEHSKWEGEQLLADAVRSGQLPSLTVYRPSITVSDSADCPMPGQQGISQLVKTLAMIARITGKESKSGSKRRFDTRQLRLCARPDDPVHLAPLGWVVKVFLYLLARPALHGQVYHLALAEPPTVDELRKAVEKRFELQLGAYTDDPLWENSDREGLEEKFYGSLMGVRHYFRQRMRFSSRNLPQALEGSALGFPRYDDAMWNSLFDAVLGNSRKADSPAKPKAKPAADSTTDACRGYFNCWLPRYAPQSKLRHLKSLTVDIGFWLEDGGDWTCRFKEGELCSIESGAELSEVGAGYRANGSAFLDVVCGRIEPQDIFYSGRATIVGDIETGLKFAMILY